MSDYRAHPVTRVEELQELVGGDPHPVVPLKLFDSLEPRALEFIGRSPFLLLSTSDRTGRQDVSPKGDAPGFVWVENDKTLWIPDRPGNKLAFGHKNILENPHVGLLFLIPGTEETLRVNGTAELHADAELLGQLAARGRPAVLAVRVAVEECFFHCAKAFKRAKLWKPDIWPERFRISFGELLAPRMGGGAAEVRMIDEAVETDARERL
jgi:PPOX class probable FMN-dependent enzyme